MRIVISALIIIIVGIILSRLSGFIGSEIFSFSKVFDFFRKSRK